MVGTVKLTYIKSQKRYTKMVKGNRWYSTSPLSQSDADFAKALTEFTLWKKQQSSPDKLPSDIRNSLQRMRDTGISTYSELAEHLEQRAIAGDELNTVDLRPYGHSDASQAIFNHQADQGELRRTGGIATYGQALTEFEAFKKLIVGDAKWSTLNSKFAFIRPYLQNIELGKISLQEWEKLFAAIKTNKNWSPATAGDTLILTRSFFKWLHETTRASTPPFVTSSIYKIDKEYKQIEFFSVEEIELIMAAATPIQKLHYQLMLNCGMTAADLSELKPSQVDYKNGTLTRRRGKHKKNASANIPTVRYKLWDCCLSGLQKLGNKTGENVFLADDGKPLCGKSRRDKVADEFDKIQETTGIEKTVKYFRKSGASAIGSHTQFKIWREVYLANVPKGTTDKHYDGTTELPAEVTEHIRTFFKLGTI
ncbi:Tyrosine recombinase XerC [Rubinisphaera italica]|uniref:Tyrosine recombinase XerC n=2 Tax=Rubinisphaera italica TaxID=2527969 RepID=A0A5C5XND6_9PLAN|nr:Tyrosine recombinase XerC [Rubinisphaera italica]